MARRRRADDSCDRAAEAHGRRRRRWGIGCEGDLLEVCNCDVLCPCWIGEDPDNGTCDSALGYRINSGQIDGVDVGGVVMASLVAHPGQRALPAAGAAALRRRAAPANAQAAAVIEVMTGRLGGPMADLAALIGEELPPRRARVAFDLHEGTGRFAIAGIAEAVMEPFRGPDRAGDDAERERLHDDAGRRPPMSPGRSASGSGTRGSATTSTSRGTTPSRAASASRRDRRIARRGSGGLSSSSGWRWRRSPGSRSPLWAASPWARYLDHGDWTRLGLVGAICAAVPGGGVLLPARSTSAAGC